MPMIEAGPTGMRASLCAGVLALLAFTAWGQGTAPTPAARPPAYPTPPAAPAPGAPAARQPAPSGDLDERDIPVLVVAGEETTLSSQMAGKIKKVNYGLGDNVRAGAVLMEFDCAEQEAQLQSAQAEYRGARETHLTKMRLQALGAAGELEVTVAAAAADKAKSQITFRESQIAYCKVPAPFPGRIAKIRIKLAESVAIGQPMVDMLNPATLKAQLYVPASWIGWLKPGTPFQVRTGDDGRTYRARIVKLNSRVEGVSQSLELEGRFEGRSQTLLPGMVGTAVFPGRPKK
jgi:membrane fusion protein (multidrug efflux system)